MTPSKFYNLVADKLDAEAQRNPTQRQYTVYVERELLRSIRREEQKDIPISYCDLTPLPKAGFVGFIFGFPMNVVNQDGYGIQVFAKRDFSKCY
jgi:hypothetical protein